MNTLVAVDRLFGLDRFTTNLDSTGFSQYGKTTIEIPVKLQTYLIDIINKNLGRKLTVSQEIEWVRAAIYCVGFKIQRMLKEDGLLDNDTVYTNSKFYFLFYTYVEEAVNIVDFYNLYHYLDNLESTDNVDWTKLCGSIHDIIIDHAYPLIANNLKEV